MKEKSYLVESDDGTARKYYHITEKGRIYQVQLPEERNTFAAAASIII